MKKRLLFTFPANRIEAPVVYHLVKDFDVKVIILNADITPGREGKLLLELRAPAENIEKAEEYILNMNIRISPAMKSIILREDDCVHCGSCTSVCFSDALTMDSSSRRLIFSPENCIACELCVKACPLSLFSINFS
jgi:L-aspartate semialdehyde sulfurtransferase ferredoxin